MLDPRGRTLVQIPLPGTCHPEEGVWEVVKGSVRPKLPHPILSGALIRPKLSGRNFSGGEVLPEFIAFKIIGGGGGVACAFFRVIVRALSWCSACLDLGAAWNLRRLKPTPPPHVIGLSLTRWPPRLVA